MLVFSRNSNAVAHAVDWLLEHDVARFVYDGLTLVETNAPFDWQIAQALERGMYVERRGWRPKRKADGRAEVTFTLRPEVRRSIEAQRATPAHELAARAIEDVARYSDRAEADWIRKAAAWIRTQGGATA